MAQITARIDPSVARPGAAGCALEPYWAERWHRRSDDAMPVASSSRSGTFRLTARFHRHKVPERELQPSRGSQEREMYPSGNKPVQTVQEIGQLLRDERKVRGMTQADFAMMLGVGRRFLIDLERGKETIEAGKMLSVLVQAGFVVRVGKEG